MRCKHEWMDDSRKDKKTTSRNPKAEVKHTLWVLKIKKEIIEW